MRSKDLQPQEGRASHSVRSFFRQLAPRRGSARSIPSTRAPRVTARERRKSNEEDDFARQERGGRAASRELTSCLSRQEPDCSASPQGSSSVVATLKDSPAPRMAQRCARRHCVASGERAREEVARSTRA